MPATSKLSDGIIRKLPEYLHLRDSAIFVAPRLENLAGLEMLTSLEILDLTGECQIRRAFRHGKDFCLQPLFTLQ